MRKKDITDRVERLQEFENRLKVRFEALSAFITHEEGDTEFSIIVRGELHALSGTEIEQNINLCLSIHDADNRVIETVTDYVDSESFFGFYTFDLRCYVDTSKIAKLRIIPRKH